MVFRRIRSVFVTAVLLALSKSTNADEIGEVVWNSFKGFPSYMVGAGPAIGRGFSLGLQVDALLNVNGLLSTVVPPMEHFPRIWVEGRWMALSWSAVKALSSSLSSEDIAIGPFFGFSGHHVAFGTGIAVVERLRDDAPFRWVISKETRISGNYEVTKTTYYPISGPGVGSLVLMVNMSFEDMGKNWRQNTSSSSNSYTLNPGMKMLLCPSIRIMRANNFAYQNRETEEIRTFRRFTYQDIGVPMAPNLSALGLSYEVCTMERFVNFKAGMALILRRDHPESGFHAEEMYLPLWISFTFGGNVVPVTEADKAFRTKFRRDAKKEVTASEEEKQNEGSQENPEQKESQDENQKENLEENTQGGENTE